MAIRWQSGGKIQINSPITCSVRIPSAERRATQLSVWKRTTAVSLLAPSAAVASRLAKRYCDTQPKTRPGCNQQFVAPL